MDLFLYVVSLSLFCFPFLCQRTLQAERLLELHNSLFLIVRGLKLENEAVLPIYWSGLRPCYMSAVLSAVH